jgi:hypothetical protein
VVTLLDPARVQQQQQQHQQLMSGGTKAVATLPNMHGFATWVQSVAAAGQRADNEKPASLRHAPVLTV